MDTVGEGESEMNGESSIHKDTLSGLRWIAGEKLLCSTGGPAWHFMMTWKDRMQGREGGSRGKGYMYNYG